MFWIFIVCEKRWINVSLCRWHSSPRICINKLAGDFRKVIVKYIYFTIQKFLIYYNWITYFNVNIKLSCEAIFLAMTRLAAVFHATLFSQAKYKLSTKLLLHISNCYFQQTIIGGDEYIFLNHVNYLHSIMRTK